MSRRYLKVFSLKKLKIFLSSGHWSRQFQPFQEIFVPRVVKTALSLFSSSFWWKFQCDKWLCCRTSWSFVNKSSACEKNYTGELQEQHSKCPKYKLTVFLVKKITILNIEFEFSDFGWIFSRICRHCILIVQGNFMKLSLVQIDVFQIKNILSFRCQSLSRKV